MRGPSWITAWCCTAAALRTATPTRTTICRSCWPDGPGAASSPGGTCKCRRKRRSITSSCHYSTRRRRRPPGGRQHWLDQGIGRLDFGFRPCPTAGNQRARSRPIRFPPVRKRADIFLDSTKNAGMMNRLPRFGRRSARPVGAHSFAIFTPHSFGFAARLFGVSSRRSFPAHGDQTTSDRCTAEAKPHRTWTTDFHASDRDERCCGFALQPGGM